MARPAPETYSARSEIPKITGQRLGSASVTRGNVAGSHTPGNITPETGGRIRTSAWRRTPSEHPRDRSHPFSSVNRPLNSPALTFSYMYVSHTFLIVQVFGFKGKSATVKK
jgi:hypothetical protein